MAAERELIYRIRFVEDEASRDTLQRIKREGVAIQQEVERSSARRKAAADADARESQRAADRRIRDEQRVQRETERAAQRTTREKERAAREQQRLQTQAAREQEREQAKQEREQARLTRQAEREAKALTRTQEKEAKAQATAKAKEAKAAADAELKERRRVAAEAAQLEQGLANRAESQGAIAANARQKFTQAGLEGSEAILRVSRGIVAAGLVGEKDLEVLARSLVKLQAGIDVVAGSAKLWIKGAEAVRAYRQAVEAASAAEAALVALRARAAAAETVGSAAGGLRAAAGRTAGGVASSAVAGAAGQALAGRIAGAAAGAGGAAAAGGGGAAAGAGGTAVVGAGGTILAFVAAIASAGAALKVLWEMLSGSSKEAGSWTQTIANAEVKVAEFARIVDLGGKTVEAAEAKREKLLEHLGRREALDEAQAPLAARPLAKEQALADARLRFYSGPAQFKPVAFAEEETRTRFDSIKTGLRLGETTGGAERSQLLDRQAELATRLVSLAEQRFQIERDLAEKTKQKAEETLRLREEELSTVREQLKERSERLVGAAERFGQLSPQEQARAIEAKQKADRLGPQALSKEERQTLRGIGLDATTAAARQGDLLDAERGGFSRFFGQEERRDIGALQAQERKTTLEIKGQRELLIRLEKQEATEVSRAAAEIAKLVTEREDAITAKIRDEVQKQLQAINRQTNQQARQRAAAAG